MYILEAIGTVFFLVIIPLFLILSLITALVSVIRQTRLGKAQVERDEARRWAHKLWRENEALDAQLLGWEGIVKDNYKHERYLRRQRDEARQSARKLWQENAGLKAERDAAKEKNRHEASEMLRLLCDRDEDEWDYERQRPIYDFYDDPEEVPDR